ncbi:Pyridoxal reductase [Pseudocercospora fuligena]|uniref:Pyridoxal reductase n=1 Tax=Pseudocercospora fuligena TaxID=685502 RepID=A0A8H6RAP6_9PEZI|nr:Pyridoxal reductase [Pseudocercospora fuligena]
MPLTIAGKPVGAIGYGCIPLTNYFTPIPKEQGFAVLKEALKHGANFWNGGWIYGTPEWNSLHFFKEYFEKYPEDVDKVVISIKGCFDMRSGSANADRESVRRAIEKCLEVADGKFKIDVFQAARLDPNLPVEETVGAIGEYVKAGKIGGIGLSECSAASIRKAAVVHPISAVEVEVSLFETSIFTDGVAEACKEFDIPIVAYSPLGRGFLTGQIRKLEDLPEKDFRRMLPRFQPENFDANLKIVDEVEQIAKKKGCTSGQIATAWVIQQTASTGATAIPIPGTGNPARIEENVKVVELTPNELKEINDVLSKAEVKGDRYPAQFEKWLKV